MFRKIYLFLARIPRKFGCGQYRPGIKYFLCRQIFHFLGASLVGLSALGLAQFFDSDVAKNSVAAVLGGMMFGIIAFGEAGDVQNGQRPYKTITDLLVWCIGFAIPVMFI